MGLIVLVGPEIPFGLADEIVGIRIEQLTFGHGRGTRMIGMGVSEDHLGDGFRLDACCLQVGGEFAGTGLEVAAGAVIDEDQVAAVADERDIGLNRRAGRIAAEPRQDRSALFRRRIGKQDFGGQSDEAVADDGDIEGAVRKAMKLRRIGAARQGKGRRAREARRPEADGAWPIGRDCPDCSSARLL